MHGGAHGVAQPLDALLAGDDGLVPEFPAGPGVRDEERMPVQFDDHPGDGRVAGAPGDAPCGVEGPGQAGHDRSGDGGLGQGQAVRLQEPGKEIPDGGAAVVEDVVAAAAGAVADGEADGMDEVVDVGGDDAVPTAVDQAQLADAHCLHDAGG